MPGEIPIHITGDNRKYSTYSGKWFILSAALRAHPVYLNHTRSHVCHEGMKVIKTDVHDPLNYVMKDEMLLYILFIGVFSCIIHMVQSSVASSS